MNANSDKRPNPPPPPGRSPTAGQTPPASAQAPAPPPAAPTTQGDKPEPDGQAAEGKSANRSKIFIVVGEIHEFASAAQAEKFLNQPGAPSKFTVLRGHKVESKQRVSLRG